MHESLTESVFFKKSQTVLCGEDSSEQGLVLQTWDPSREGAQTCMGHYPMPLAGQRSLDGNTESRLAPRQ